jgi:uncharacterized protein with PQ loop repeat
MTAGVVQVGLQWFCFGIVFVLYMIYYPEHLKYVEIGIDDTEQLRPLLIKTPVKSEEWRLSIILAWVTVAHFFFVAFMTAYLLATAPASPSDTIVPQISLWATFLGVSSATLATIQYAPQLLHTYRMKLVGALSIPMMIIQTPGGLLMVTSIVLRPGTNWTSWITFAVAAVLQGCLLAMCIAWKIRQRKLHIDDFGNPLDCSPPRNWSRIDPDTEETAEVHDHSLVLDDDDSVPGLVTTPSGPERDMNEQTPLLRRSDTNGSPTTRSDSDSRKSAEAKGWQAWFGR